MENIRIVQYFFPSIYSLLLLVIGCKQNSVLKHLIQSVNKLVTLSTAFTITMLLCPHH